MDTVKGQGCGNLNDAFFESLVPHHKITWGSSCRKNANYLICLLFIVLLFSSTYGNKKEHGCVSKKLSIFKDSYLSQYWPDWRDFCGCGIVINSSLL